MHFIVCNGMEHYESLIHNLSKIYQKRWKIELYNKSIKQNTSLTTSLTKRVISQTNHIFSSLIAFCKLEFFKIKTPTNHFTMKYKILLKTNSAAFMKFTNFKQYYSLI